MLERNYDKLAKEKEERFQKKYIFKSRERYVTNIFENFLNYY